MSLSLSSTRSCRSDRNSKVVDVSCGTYSTFVTLTTGSVYACGLNNYGQLGLRGQDIVYSFSEIPIPEGHQVTRVCPGQHHSLFITEKGLLLSCGRPTYGRLGQQDVDVSSDKPCPEIRKVDGIDGVKVVGAAAGLAVSGCFDSVGSVWLWGFGTSNQLGKGDDDEDEVTPKRVSETKKFNNQKVYQLDFGGQHVALLSHT